MSYEPAPGTVAARAIDFLRARGPQSSTELAEGIGIHPKQLAGSLAAGLTHGALAREKATDGLFRWKIPAPDTSAEVATFMRRMVSPPADQADNDEETEPGHCRTCLPEIADAIGAELVAAPPKPPGVDWKAPAVPVFIQAGPFTNADVDEVQQSAQETPSGGSTVFESTDPKACQPHVAASNGVQFHGESRPDSPHTETARRDAVRGRKDDPEVHRVTPRVSARTNEGETAAPVCHNGTSPRSRFALWSDGHLQFDCGAGIRFLLCPDDTRALVKYLERIAVGEGA